MALLSGSASLLKLIRKKGIPRKGMKKMTPTKDLSSELAFCQERLKDVSRAVREGRRCPYSQNDALANIGAIIDGLKSVKKALSKQGLVKVKPNGEYA